MNLYKSKEEILLYAAHHYDSLFRGMNEFYKDLNIILYIKRIFRSLDKGTVTEQKVRLTLNHFITLYNVFESKALHNILFSTLPSQYYSLLKTFLVYLNYINQNSVIINFRKSEYINIDEIPINKKIEEILNGI